MNRFDRLKTFYSDYMANEVDADLKPLNQAVKEHFRALLHAVASELDAADTYVNPDTNTAYLVWRFEDAPKELQLLSNHGGDEDWVCYVPAERVGEWASWTDQLGVCDTQEIHLQCGARVLIGAHA